jgi:methylated-DNA-[protein]-cysteine S-methyltransferase
MPQLSLHSPIGDLAISEEDGYIVAVDWGWGCDQDETPVLLRARDQLNAYFDGDLTAFDLPLAPAGTAFQLKVWQAMQRIPFGEVKTYGAIAREIKSASNGSTRAVGMACGANPIPILIPCHRVVAANGLGGYSGDGGLGTKQHLLDLEGWTGR